LKISIKELGQSLFQTLQTLAKLEKGKHYQRGLRRFKTPDELVNVSEAYYYDLIISSGELKKLILARIEELDVNLSLVLKEAGIKDSTFRLKYLRTIDPVSTPALRQSHMIRLLVVLGIKTRVQFVVEDKEDVEAEHLKYKK